MKLDYLKTAEKIRNALCQYIQKFNLETLVIGISGGIDSALVAALSYPVVKKLGIELIGLSIPIESNKPDEKNRAKMIGKSFCTGFTEIDLTEDFNTLYNNCFIDNKDSINRGNAKARLRMIYLYGYARIKKGVVMSTDNKTELLLGFWTLHGDVGDLGIIQDLWKTHVYNMTECLIKNDPTIDTNGQKALKGCIECDATDGLGVSGTDLDQLMPDWRDRHKNTREGYKEVDERLKKWMTKKSDPNFPDIIITQDPIINRNINTEGKRISPYNLKFEDIAVIQ